MTITLARLDDIETAIDQCENFAEFLELVAKVCNEKAGHVQEDELLAEIWEKRAKLIGEVSELVEFEVQTGTTVLEIAGEPIRDKYFVPIESGKPPSGQTYKSYKNDLGREDFTEMTTLEMVIVTIVANTMTRSKSQ